jgi:hypothetical protein
MNTIDNPFLVPLGTYPPATTSWDYFCDTVSPDEAVTFAVPYQPGTPLGLLIPVKWSVTDIFFRQETAGSSNSTLQITRSTVPGPFSFFTTTNINDVPIIIPSGQNECIGRPFTLATIDNPVVNSGDKLGLALSPGTGSGQWSFYVTLTQTPGV